MNVETIPVGPFEANCFLAWGTDNKALVIDPGASHEQILEQVSMLGLKIATYLLTHGHTDHTSAIGQMYEKAPAPIVIHEKDLEWIGEQHNEFPPFYSVPDMTGIKDIVKVAAGETRNDGGLDYKVLGAPGHTPGGICFYFESQKVLFTGDTIFAGSIGRTDLPGGDMQVFTKSLQALMSLPDDTRIFPGHGPESTIGRERKSNPFLSSL